MINSPSGRGRGEQTDGGKNWEGEHRHIVSHLYTVHIRHSYHSTRMTLTVTPLLYVTYEYNFLLSLGDCLHGDVGVAICCECMVDTGRESDFL